MGIFNFLKNLGKKENKQPKEEKSNILSIHTIEPDNEITNCYDEIFKVMMADISGISNKDINEIPPMSG